MNSRATFVISTIILLTTQRSVSAERVCNDIPLKGSFFTLSVNRKVDRQSGDWIRTYTAQNTDSENPRDDILLEATHSNVECQGKNIARLEVVVRELKNNASSVDKRNNFLTFHKRHGKNVVVEEEGIVAQKLDPNDPLNAVLFTNRPLKNEEIFEIRLEKKVKKTNHALGIGVVSFSPDDVEILPQMHIRNQTWIMHHSNIYQSNGALKVNYGNNLDTLEVNDRVGVLRRANGELHYLINDVDQGTAAVVPESVYGILELWHDANRVRILHNPLRL